MLKQLQRAYQQKPDHPLVLPKESEEQLKIFETIKKTIVQYTNQSKLGEAEQLTHLATKIAQQTGNQNQAALADWCSGLFHLNRDVQRSAKYLKKTADYYHKTGDSALQGRVLIGYASQINTLGKFQEAEEAIEHSINCLQPWPDYHDWPMIYINQSYVFFMQNRYIQAIESAEQAESLARRLASDYPQNAEYHDMQRVQALINRGATAVMSNQAQLAEESLHSSILLAEKYSANRTIGIAHLNLARLYTLRGELFEAFRMLQNARQHFKIAQCENEEMIALQHEADIYRQLKMPRHTREASIQAAHSFGEKKLVVDCVEAYITAIDIALSEKRSRLARQYLDTCSPMLAEAPRNLSALWKCYNAHPLLLRTKQQRLKAIQIIQESATELEEVGNLQYALTVRLFGTQLAAKLRQKDVTEQYQAIINKAKEEEMAHIEQQACLELASLQRPKESEGTLRRAADILVQTRQMMPIEELKANLLTGQMGIYVQLIETQLKNHDQIAAAQTLMEAKGGIWADFMRRSRQSEEPIHDDTWLRTRAELSYWQEQLQLARQEESDENAPVVIQCQEKFEEARVAFTRLTRAISYTTQNDQRPISLPNISDVQQWLQKYEQANGKRILLLDYFVGTSHVHVCLVSADQIQWLELGQAADIKQLMFRLDILLEAILGCETIERRQAVADAQKGAADQVLLELYQKLFKPLDALLAQQPVVIDHLAIVPDQFLFSLPWTALYNSHTYLGERYQLDFYPSTLAPVLGEILPHIGKRNQSARLLGYQGKENPLLYLHQELSQIQAHFSDTVVINPARTDDFVWDHPPSCLHIAAHGLLDARAPLFSSLEMEDASFLLADVFKLNLHGTDLVTLSACQTGVTPEQGGVVLALVGAFLCAGAETVLSSLWSVDDQATQLLMNTFYQTWQSGQSVTTALQHAQSRLRETGFNHPFYWAAFQPLSR